MKLKITYWIFVVNGMIVCPSIILYLAYHEYFAGLGLATGFSFGCGYILGKLKSPLGENYL